MDTIADDSPLHFVMIPMQNSVEPSTSRISNFCAVTMVTGMLVVLGTAVMSSPRRSEVGTDFQIVKVVNVVDFPEHLVLFETVFWEPGDTMSLRALIRAARIAERKDVLEIGTGSGLLSLCCAKHGANRIVATDINPAAVANARHNADRLGIGGRLEVRQVRPNHPGAFAVLKPEERFDLILSNPPWENRTPTTIDTYALDDDQFALMQSLLSGLRQHLKPGGRAFLAYGCVSAIRELQKMAPRYGLRTQIHDSRNLDDLDEVFLPGMLIIVTPAEPSRDPRYQREISR